MSAHFTRELTIGWGDCDPAGTVFYPQYLVMCDRSTWFIMSKTVGVPERDLYRTFDTLGWPLVRLEVEFAIPSAYGDVVRIESQVIEAGRSSFKVRHRVLKGDALALEVRESRVFVREHPDNPGAFKPMAIPEAFTKAWNLG